MKMVPLFDGRSTLWMAPVRAEALLRKAFLLSWAAAEAAW